MNSADLIWSQQQSNYFYGEATVIEVDADGAVNHRRWRLDASKAPLPAQPETRLEPAALAQLLALLQDFMDFEPVQPSSVIPDNFPWICRASQNGRIQELSLYANSPPEQCACLDAIQKLLS